MATFENLPDKVLQMIFRNLNFQQQIRLTVVSRRWNRVIFRDLEDRVRFLLTENQRIGTLNRTYRHVCFHADKLTKATALSPDLLRLLGQSATSLEVDTRGNDAGLVLELLRPFRSVVDLRLNLEVFSVKSMKAAEFVAGARGILPEVRHLTVNAHFYKTVGLLAEIAPQLVTLDVDLREALLPLFFGCRFDSLRELALKMMSIPMPYQPRCFRVSELPDFLSRHENLRKLTMDIMLDFATWDFSMLTGIEELTLSSRISCISGLSRMTVLRSLVFNSGVVSFGDTEPVPSLATLQMNKASSIEVAKLTRLFPNLTTLYLRDRDLTTAEVQQIVDAWPSLQEFSFEMTDFDAPLLVPLQNLRELRKLTLDATVKNEAELAAFAGVLALESLRELCVVTYGEVDVATLLQWNATMADKYRSCAIVIEEARPKQDEGQACYIYPLDD